MPPRRGSNGFAKIELTHRIAGQLGTWSIESNPAVSDAYDAIGVGIGQLDLCNTHNTARFVCSEMAHQAHDVVGSGVQARCRLVREQHPRALGERASNRDALRLPAR